MEFLLVSEAREKVVLPGDMVSANVPLTGVAWERELALVVDMGEQRTAGYAVEVAGINLAGGDEVELTLRVTQPGPGDFVAQVLTHPYAVTRIPRVGLRPGTITVVARDQSGREIARQEVTL